LICWLWESFSTLTPSTTIVRIGAAGGRLEKKSEKGRVIDIIIRGFIGTAN